MKRTLLCCALVAITGLAPVPAAQADHVCVTSGGEPVYCADHLAFEDPRQICVTSGGRDLVCVF